MGITISISIKSYNTNTYILIGTRCFWDAGTDNYASETFMNDNIFCVATAYSVYLY